jgi:hypothetical protein
MNTEMPQSHPWFIPSRKLMEVLDFSGLPLQVVMAMTAIVTTGQTQMGKARRLPVQLLDKLASLQTIGLTTLLVIFVVLVDIQFIVLSNKSRSFA